MKRVKRFAFWFFSAPPGWAFGLGALLTMGLDVLAPRSVRLAFPGFIVGALVTFGTFRASRVKAQRERAALEAGKNFVMWICLYSDHENEPSYMVDWRVASTVDPVAAGEALETVLTAYRQQLKTTAAEMN